jgi:hypothetical protein
MKKEHAGEEPEKMVDLAGAYRKFAEGRREVEQIAAHSMQVIERSRRRLTERAVYLDRL